MHAAYLSHILADLAYDLGVTLTAKAWAIDSQPLAEQAGHGELLAWAADTMASVARHGGAFSDAAKIALNGLTRVPPQHFLAARLRIKAALAYADQGNRTASMELIRDARQVCEQLPDQMPSRLATDSAERISYTVATNAASCFVTLGEWKQAERQARIAFGVGRWSPGRAAYAQLDLGMALTHLGFPGEAAEQSHAQLSVSFTQKVYGSAATQGMNNVLYAGRRPRRIGRHGVVLRPVLRPEVRCHGIPSG